MENGLLSSFSLWQFVKKDPTYITLYCLLNKKSFHIEKKECICALFCCPGKVRFPGLWNISGIFQIRWRWLLQSVTQIFPIKSLWWMPNRNVIASYICSISSMYVCICLCTARTTRWYLYPVYPEYKIVVIPNSLTQSQCSMSGLC